MTDFVSIEDDKEVGIADVTNHVTELIREASGEMTKAAVERAGFNAALSVQLDILRVVQRLCKERGVYLDERFQERSEMAVKFRNDMLAVTERYWYRT